MTITKRVAHQYIGAGARASTRIWYAVPENNGDVMP